MVFAHIQVVPSYVAVMRALHGSRNGWLLSRERYLMDLRESLKAVRAPCRPSCIECKHFAVGAGAF